MSIKFELIELKDTDNNAQFNVALWLIEDHVNLAWHQYIMNIVHLRDVADGKPPILLRPDCTHEMMCHALDPKDSDLDTSDIIEIAKRRLSPVNMVYQWTSENDAAAFEFIENLLQQAPSVDTDYRQWWTHWICHEGNGTVL